jgi:hypothetical protein
MDGWSAMITALGALIILMLLAAVPPYPTPETVSMVAAFGLTKVIAGFTVALMVGCGLVAAGLHFGTPEA